MPTSGQPARPDAFCRALRRSRRPIRTAMKPCPQPSAALRPLQQRAIIRETRLDDETRSPNRSRILFRRSSPPPVGIWSMSAILDVEPVIDRLPETNEQPTSITELLARSARGSARSVRSDPSARVSRAATRCPPRARGSPERHAVHDGARPRALSQVLARAARRLAQPLALPERRRRGDAPHPRGSRETTHRGQARRSAASGDARRQPDRHRHAGGVAARAPRSARPARAARRATRARRRVPLLRRHDRTGDGRGAARHRADRPTRLDQGARTAVPGARRCNVGRAHEPERRVATIEIARLPVARTLERAGAAAGCRARARTGRARSLPR